MRKKVLILGGGYAGVETALALNRKKGRDDIEITVIDKNDYHTLLTELHEVAGNRIDEDGIIIPFQRIFKHIDVNYVTDEITGFDFDNKKISSARREYAYDYLILAMGSTPNFFGIPGLKEHAFTLWSYDDAIRIREHIRDCFVQARSETDAVRRKRLLTFVVAGAGFTGVEMIGELAIWVKRLCREYGIARDDVRLMIVDMLPRVLNTLNEKNAAKAHRYMEKKLGIEIRLKTAVGSVSADGFQAGEEFIPTATVIWAAGVRASEDVEKLAVEKVAARRLKVDEYCATQHEGVYAVGDISGFSGKNEKPYPAMVENAIQTGHGAAVNILKSIRGEKPEPVTVKMHGTMVCVGNYFAVSEIMGYSLPVWLSVIMKFLVNIHYLWEITGFSGVAKYLQHELLGRRQNKNIVEQHYTTRSLIFLLTPLRIYLGSIWLYEGIKKVGEGWLATPKLAGFFGGAEAFYRNVLQTGGTASAGGSATVAMANDAVSAATAVAGAGTVDAVSSVTASAAADAVSAATGAAGEAAASAVKVLLNWGFGWLRFLAVDAGQLAAKVDFTPVNWVTDNILIRTEGTQMFFQWLVTGTEIIIGLCLIAGAFTFLASGLSLLLQANFLMTTGIYMDTWWMFFAAVAVLAGAGRAFGLDYYLMPYLNNYWERIWKTGKWGPVFKNAFSRTH
ncbi:MAG: NAD(P)/FAD-dependent oxidoreductase [bacterium]